MAPTVHVFKPEETSWNVAKHAKPTDTAFTRPSVQSTRLEPRVCASKITSSASIAEGDGVYTQKRVLASTPGATQNPLLRLSHPCYGLPERLVTNLSSLSINLIYPWQSACLLGRGMLSGEGNLVYTAPTGGGKSLVADILMLKQVLQGKKAILVLPYVALVQEKLKWLRRAVEGLERFVEVSTQGDLRNPQDHRAIHVVGFFGGSSTRAAWDDADIAVCTIEKVPTVLVSVRSFVAETS